MITHQFLCNLHTRHKKPLSRHAKLSALTLSRLSRELSKYPLPHKVDASFPYHLIINCNGVISAYCSGFTKAIYIQRLSLDEKPDFRFKEKSFMTPKGATNYILKKWGKRGK